MFQYNLPEKHTLGIEFFRFSNLQPLNADDYFKCLNLIKPLFKNSDFQAATPGFYINRITNIEDDHGDSVRLTYYTVNPLETIRAINDFATTNKEVSLFNSKNSNRPGNTSLTEYDGNEMKFKNFLHRNTQICLEALEGYGISSFQELVARYRYDLLPQRIPPELILEPIFVKHSNYFNKLKDNSLALQYWEDLVYLHPGNNFGLHFMVNIVAMPESAYHPWWVAKNWVLRANKQ